MPVSASTSVAESYVRLALALGKHDIDYIDAYYGPAQWKVAADSATVSLPEIARRAGELLGRVREGAATDAPDIERHRHEYLSKQLEAMTVRVAMLQGVTLSFDEEARSLYDVTPPTHSEEYFQNLVSRLDDVLPGTGPVPARYVNFRNQFVIPPERLDVVFQAAIAEGKRRTAPHITLPPNETFVVEFVRDKPWSGYNWYKGNYHSVIQVNTSLPIYVDRAVDLACHEGYPGHHVYNALLEKTLVRDRGWLEFCVYGLFTPQSLIAEGTANYGIRMALPDEERIEFEQTTLFPLAGLPASRANEYYRVQAMVQALSYSGNEAARRYLNGEIDAAAAASWLEHYALASPAAAQQRVRFFDKYRSYVINYNVGQDLVGAYVERTAGPNAVDRWRVFGELLSTPRTPSGLQSS